MNTRGAVVADDADTDNLEVCTEMLANHDQELPPRPPPEPKQSRVNFCWTQESEIILINMVVKHDAHHKTKGAKMETKWNNVRTELLGYHDRFKYWQDMKWESLRAKFQRMLSDVDNKYAISTEGANLSGLPEEDDDTMMNARDRILRDILKDIAAEAELRKADKEKAHAQQEQMYTHEKTILDAQALLLPNSSSPGSSSPHSTVSDSHPTSSSSRGSKRQRLDTPSPLQNQYLFDGNQIVDLLKGDSEAAAFEAKERNFELERKQKDFNMQLKERELDLEQRKEAIEMQKALVESVKAQTELMRKFLSSREN